MLCLIIDCDLRCLLLHALSRLRSRNSTHHHSSAEELTFVGQFQPTERFNVKVKGAEVH